MKLALVMIARDEARHLAACVESARGLVDTIVVVDTGSTDGTPEIARGLGATVVPFAWCDDFAAARNAALPHVDAEWLLVLDADERLSRRGWDAIRAAMADPTLDIGMMPRFEADAEDAPFEEVVTGARGIPSIVIPRLLRRTPGLQWRGRVHENPVGIVETPERVKLVEAPFAHYGALHGVRTALAKSERNIRLLRIRCEEEPDDCVPWCYLVEELRGAGRTAEAAEATATAWALCVRSWEPPGGGPPTRRPPPTRLLIRVATASLAVGRLDEAAEAVDRVVSWVGAIHPSVRYMRGIVREAAARASEDDRAWRSGLLAALDDFRACARVHGVAFTEPAFPEMTGRAACTRITMILLALGQADAAAAFASAGREQHGGDAALDAAYAQSLLAQEQPRAALDVLRGREDADALALVALAHHQLGADADAATAVRAAAAATSGWRERERGLALRELARALGLTSG